MSQTVQVYCLAPFTEDEADEILTQLEDDSHDSYSSSNVRVDLIPWTHDRDGGKDDIFRLFFESHEVAEDYMFFLDRASLDRQDFLIADVRAAKKAITLSELSSAQCPVIEADINPVTRSERNSQDTQILLGRCGGDEGWYGNPYSGIKKTYLSLVSGQITFDEIVCKNRQGRGRPTKTCLTSSVLDKCDEAYSAQIRLAQRQADLLCLELQVRPSHNSEEIDNSSEHAWNSRDAFCHSSSLWGGSSANNYGMVLSPSKG